MPVAAGPLVCGPFMDHSRKPRCVREQAFQYKATHLTMGNYLSIVIRRAFVNEIKFKLHNFTERSPPKPLDIAALLL